MRYAVLVIFLFFTFSPHLQADWNFFINNYEKKEYGAGSQTWQISTYKDQYIFCANSNGLLQFDGSQWKLMPLVNDMDARSLHVSLTQRRIYVGGINEFGYFEADKKGMIAYTSLSDSLSDSLSEDKVSCGNIWKIYELDNTLYYQGDKIILKQFEDKSNIAFKKIESRYKIDCSALIDDLIYIGTEKGVCRLLGQEFMPIPGNEILLNKKIRAISKFKGGILIATASHGIFFFDGNIIEPFETYTGDFLLRNEIFTISQYENILAVGTVRGGIVLLNAESHQVDYINEMNGLQNNTVLSMDFDQSGRLWAGLDNGIDCIHLHSPFTSLYTNTQFLGAGYGAEIHDRWLYLATNRGLYRTEKTNAGTQNMEYIAGSSGQVWSLARIGEQLFCCHDKGLFVVDGKGLHKINGLANAWKILPFDTNEQKMWVGAYDGLYILEKEYLASKKVLWKCVKKIKWGNESFRDFEVEGDSLVYLRNSQLGILRIALNKDNFEIIEGKYYSKKEGHSELPDANKNIHITKIGGQVLFPSSKGVFYFDNAKNIFRLKNVQIPQSTSSGGNYFLQLITKNDLLFGLTSKQIMIGNWVSDQFDILLKIPRQIQNIDLSERIDGICILPDSSIIFPNEMGFSKFNVRQILPQAESKKIFIKNFFINQTLDSLVFSSSFNSSPQELIIPWKYNNILIEYAAHNFDKESIEYWYRLLPNKQWIGSSNNSYKSFTSLGEGSYTFELRAEFSSGETADAAINFLILPPWYRTWYAYLLYITVAIILIFLIYRWDRYRLYLKKKKIIVQKMREQLQQKDVFEKQIFELENEKLEHELKFKVQEMANLMLNFSRKNDMLSDIKQELNKIVGEILNKDKVKIKGELMLVNRKIETNIQSDDLLKQFEAQFDILHNNFMHKLEQKHPELALNERKMCAFLKMELPSKEIAPLMNISVRGVETMRYRLRKKLNLTRDESLLDYLKSIT